MPTEEYEKQLALADWLLARQKEAERMTPEQLRQEAQQWRQFKRSINKHRAGYRKLYLD